MSQNSITQIETKNTERNVEINKKHLINISPTDDFVSKMNDSESYFSNVSSVLQHVPVEEYETFVNNTTQNFESNQIGSSGQSQIQVKGNQSMEKFPIFVLSSKSNEDFTEKLELSKVIGYFSETESLPESNAHVDMSTEGFNTFESNNDNQVDFQPKTASNELLKNYNSNSNRKSELEESVYMPPKVFVTDGDEQSYPKLAKLPEYIVNITVNYKIRKKRQVFPTLYFIPAVFDLYSVTRISGYCDLLTSSGINAVSQQINSDTNDVCSALDTPYILEISLPATPALYACSLDPACIDLVPGFLYTTVTSCSDQVSSSLKVLFVDYCASVNTPTNTAAITTTAAAAATTTTITQTTAMKTFPDPNIILAFAVVAVGAVGVTALALSPSLPIVTPQLIPPGNALVGWPGGGGLPHGISLITKLSCLLVPEGKTPVSVFPPFNSPRTRKAVCVIFAEDENIHNLNNEVIRFKRALVRNHLRRKQRSSKFLYRQFRKANYFLDKKTAHVRDSMKCLKAQIMRLFKGGKKRRKYHKEKFRKNRYDDEIISFDDCFEDVGEPRYGFICRVRLVENLPCVLGVTCQGVPDDEDDLLVDLFEPAFDLLSKQDFSDRQTGIICTYLCHKNKLFLNYRNEYCLIQGWPTFSASGPNFR
jgi:hypothetical protein